MHGRGERSGAPEGHQGERGAAYAVRFHAGAEVRRGRVPDHGEFPVRPDERQQQGPEDYQHGIPERGLDALRRLEAERRAA